MTFKLIGTAETPHGIAKVIGERRRSLNLTQLELDDLAGLQSGYSGKLECGSKRVGDMSLSSLLAALGLRLAIVADDNALPPVTRRLMAEKTLSPRAAEAVEHWTRKRRRKVA